MRAILRIIGICGAIFMSIPAYAQQRTITVTSPAFEEGAAIPAQYTCEGKNYNPALQLADMPSQARSLALIVDDPDAPMGVWVHWVVFNIPVSDRIAENSLPGIAGITSAGKSVYYGPCPPSGTHRYFFTVYALDTQLSLSGGVTKSRLLEAMQGHVLAQGKLMGTYRKQK